MRKNLPDLSALPKEVEIVDVSARDGLQSLPFPLPTHKRVLWIRALLEAGLREVEGGAFVSEERVPTMAGTEEVFAALSDLEKERVWALAPNEKGFSRAAKAGAKKIICLASATEKHSRENLGAPVDKIIEGLGSIAETARGADIETRVALSMAFGSPEQAKTPQEEVLGICARLRDAGFAKIILCDTYGAASPKDVISLLGKISDIYWPRNITLHMHDTFGHALANIFAGLLCGVSRFDSAMNGLGGCPFVPEAKGNVDTLALAGFLRSLDIQNSLDEAKLAKASAYCRGLLNP